MPLYFTMKLTIQKGFFNLYKSTRNPNFLLDKSVCLILRMALPDCCISYRFKVSTGV
ncbi:hypothetical protein Hanom_Chr02g00163131 [Helianthus anomalus]